MRILICSEVKTLMMIKKWNIFKYKGTFVDFSVSFSSCSLFGLREVKMLKIGQS